MPPLFPRLMAFIPFLMLWGKTNHSFSVYHLEHWYYVSCNTFYILVLCGESISMVSICFTWLKSDLSSNSSNKS
jgi:hypothetical protein